MKTEMTDKRGNRTPSRWQSGSEEGMTLLLTLGFLSVVMMVMLTLAMTARVERKSSTAHADLIRSRLVAESSLENVLHRLASEYQGNVYPGDDFTKAGSSWNNRRILASESPDRAGVSEALGIRFGEAEYTPEKAVSSTSGWVPVKGERLVTENGETTVKEVITGRYCYAVLDDSGKVDPSTAIDLAEDESTTTLRLGDLPTDINLSDLGLENPDAFRATSVIEGESGTMPEQARWFSMGHILNTIQPSEAETRQIISTLFPYSYDTEKFWRDRNNNGRWDEGEDADRLDICGDAQLSKIYQIFVGSLQDFSNSSVTDDDCEWLKDLDSNSWFSQWKDTAFATYPSDEREARARAHVAAQIAANIVDYSDPDDEPTQVFVDEGGSINLGSTSDGYNIQGVERAWGLSEISARIQADIYSDPILLAGGDSSTTSDSEDDVAFEIDSGEVKPVESFQATVTVLGAQLGLYNTAYNPPQLVYWCPVTCDVTVGDSDYSPFGDIDDAENSNVQDENNPRVYLVPDSFAPLTPISVTAKFFLQQSYWGRTYWSEFLTLQSNKTDSYDRVKVLRDGDSVPFFGTDSTGTQEDVSYYLEDYLEGDKISLQPNQAIYLFETNKPGATLGQDFQDLVVLITLRKADDGGSSVAGTTTEFTMEGTCNINPSNNTDFEFYLTKPNGSQITRDMLHAQQPWGMKLEYTGPATWIHVRPKGNGNQNTLYLNGDLYELKNNSVYDFYGDIESVHLFNDKWNKGKAMGHWWLGDIGGSSVEVLEDGVPYVIETSSSTSSSTETSTDTSSTEVVAGAINCLKVRTGFQVELFYPYAEDAASSAPIDSVLVDYTIEAQTRLQKEARSAVKEMYVTDSRNVDGGTVLYTSAYDDDEWLELLNAFDPADATMPTTYTITNFQINRITVQDRLGNTVDTVPAGSTYFANWVMDGTADGDREFFVGARAKDPMMNDRAASDPDSDSFWTFYPEKDVIDADALTDGSTVGQLTCGGYTSAPYCGAEVKNSALLQIGELGRVHSYMPMRSLRLWSASTSDESGHDAAILDLFKTGASTQTRGKININTLSSDVLRALFQNATTVSADDAVESVLERRTSGMVYTDIGTMFGDVSGLSGSDSTKDAYEEEAVTKLADLITVRQNYFTVVACAQAIDDVAGLSYVDSDGDRRTATYYFDTTQGQFDAVVDEDGTIKKEIDRITAEQKIMAVVYRDAFSGRMRVERFEYLAD